jgi:hypothetical protein
MGAFAEFERSLIRERQRVAYRGRKKSLPPELEWEPPSKSVNTGTSKGALLLTRTSHAFESKNRVSASLAQA